MYIFQGTVAVMIAVTNFAFTNYSICLRKNTFIKAGKLRCICPVRWENQTRNRGHQQTRLSLMENREILHRIKIERTRYYLLSSWVIVTKRHQLQIKFIEIIIYIYWKRSYNTEYL